MSLLSEEEDLLRVLDAFALCAEPVFAINERRRIVFAQIAQASRDVAIPATPPAKTTNNNHADARVRSLTSRESEILSLIAGGENAVVIAQHLGISPLTARNHIQHLFEKLEVHS